MARKVKIEKRIPRFDFMECRVDGQGKEIAKAWLVSIGVWAVPLFLILQFGPQQQHLIFYFFGWVLACWFLYLFLIPKIARARLVKQGLKIKVMGNNYPDVKRLLTATCRALGMKREPECYVVSEPIGHATVLGSRSPYFMVITAMLRGLLSDDEYNAALQRALIHARMGHVRTMMLVKFINQTPVPLQIFLAPLALYALVLHEWSTSAELSADRAWVVLNRNPRLCAGTLIKIAASADPTINATPAEVDSLFKQKNLMEQSVVELGSTYKLQNLLHENTFISQRFQELIEFAESDQAVTLANKMDEAFKVANVTA